MADNRAPTLTDLYRLSDQLSKDVEQPTSVLRERDHTIAKQCQSKDKITQLLFWLNSIRTNELEASDLHTSANERTAAVLMRVVALVLGFFTMLGFMKINEGALINVLLFLLIFVFLQLLTSLVALFVMLCSSKGRPTAAMPLNPVRLFFLRSWPDKRFVKESQGLFRLLLLRYGQEFGALFTAGAIMAFFILLAFTDFSFIWSSTFGVSDQFLTSTMQLLSAPWGSWLPQAVVPQSLITETRFHPAMIGLGQMSDAGRRGWWPFLIMCMAFYALLPRLLLWFGSRFMFKREVAMAFQNLPGVEAVLARMRAPIVRTQALEEENEEGDGNVVQLDETQQWLNWAQALGLQERAEFPLLSSVPANNCIQAGLGTMAEDLSSVQAINKYAPETLFVTVKAWEPPMAELADVLAQVQGVPRCILCLVPLPGREVTERHFQDWRTFASLLTFEQVAVERLHRL